MSPTIANNRNIIPQVEVGRPDGTTWFDLTDYVTSISIDLGNVDMIGTENGGADSVVRQASIEVINGRQDVEGDSFNVGDRNSDFNQFDNEYNPLLFPLREIVIRTAIESEQEDGSTSIYEEVLDSSSDGSQETYNTFFAPLLSSSENLALYFDGVEQDYNVDYSIDWDDGTVDLVDAPDEGTEITISYTYFRTIFHGYLGDRIESLEDGHRIALVCRDEGRILQQTYMEDYSITPNNPAEDVIQEIMDKNLPFTVDLEVPEPSGFTITSENISTDFSSVWDAIQIIATQRGWFLGYRYNEEINDFSLTFLSPPRDKEEGDFTVTAEDDIYLADLNFNDRDIRNIVEITYFDEELGVVNTLPDDDSDIDDFRNQDSIDNFMERRMRLAEEETYFIRTRQEATDLAIFAINDLSNITSTKMIEMPLFLQIDLFTGLEVDDRRLSSEVEFFAVESVRHEIIPQSGEGSTFRTIAVCSGQVTGFHSKWLRMETRPGAGKPVEQRNVFQRNHDIYIAGFNSRRRAKELADYVCNGENDFEVINKAILELSPYISDLWNLGFGQDNFEAGYNTSFADIFFVDDYINISTSSPDSEEEKVVVTAESHNLTLVDEIFIDWENTGVDNSNNESYFIVSETQNDNHEVYTKRISKTGEFGRTVDTLDVSDLEGEYYIRFHALDSDSEESASSNIRTYRLIQLPDNKGGSVHLLEGNYKLYDSVNLTNNITLTGEGTATYIRSIDNENAFVIPSETKNIHLRDFYLIYEEEDGIDEDTVGIFLENVNDIKVFNLTIENFNFGIIPEEPQIGVGSVPGIAKTTKILNNDFISNDTHISLYSEEIKISNNTFLNGLIGIQILGSADSTVIISDNDFFNYEESAIEIQGDNAQIINNNFTSSDGDNGIVIQSNAENTLISHNDFTDAGQSNDIVDDGTNTNFGVGNRDLSGRWNSAHRFDSYTGDGSLGREIEVGFRPKFVYIIAETFYTWSMIDGSPMSYVSGASQGYDDLEMTDNGFLVGTDDVSDNWPNVNDEVYFYIAIR